jgi:hypothetical protein
MTALQNPTVTEVLEGKDLSSYPAKGILLALMASAEIIDSENFSKLDKAIRSFLESYPTEASGVKDVFNLLKDRLLLTSGDASGRSLPLSLAPSLSDLRDAIKPLLQVEPTASKEGVTL